MLKQWTHPFNCEIIDTVDVRATLYLRLNSFLNFKVIWTHGMSLWTVIFTIQFVFKAYFHFFSIVFLQIVILKFQWKKDNFFLKGRETLFKISLILPLGFFLSSCIRLIYLYWWVGRKGRADNGRFNRKGMRSGIKIKRGASDQRRFSYVIASSAIRPVRKEMDTELDTSRFDVVLLRTHPVLGYFKKRFKLKQIFTLSPTLSANLTPPAFHQLALRMAGYFETWWQVGDRVLWNFITLWGVGNKKEILRYR